VFRTGGTQSDGLNQAEQSLACFVVDRKNLRLQRFLVASRIASPTRNPSIIYGFDFFPGGTLGALSLPVSTRRGRMLRPNVKRSPKRAKKEARASVPRKPPLVEETADRALQYFRLDRSVVVGQLNSLSRVLSAEALQIEMVAAERVFNKSFSSRLARLALSLQRFAKELNAMRKEAARQRSPGD
jgi:hypothetical protein